MRDCCRGLGEKGRRRRVELVSPSTPSISFFLPLEMVSLSSGHLGQTKRSVLTSALSLTFHFMTAVQQQTETLVLSLVEPQSRFQQPNPSSPPSKDLLLVPLLPLPPHYPSEVERSHLSSAHLFPSNQPPHHLPRTAPGRPSVLDSFPPPRQPPPLHRRIQEIPSRPAYDFSNPSLVDGVHELVESTRGGRRVWSGERAGQSREGR